MKTTIETPLISVLQAEFKKVESKNTSLDSSLSKKAERSFFLNF